MAAKFMELAFTEDVRKAQEHYYGRSHRIEGERPADALTADEAAFIQARDSFYMASLSASGLAEAMCMAIFLPRLSRPHCMAASTVSENALV